ncbi:MAG: EamA family transporter RarD [Coriobacteriales bacterium]|jgi:chloramphenicol-sensitive protein RarD|nr:EamA family transporter RarD [Coriobacteriales bacterium]
MTMNKEFRRGLVFGTACYAVYGLLPLYWKLLAGAPYFEVFAHRMLWGFVFMFAIVQLLRGRSAEFKALLRQRRAVLILALAGLTIAGSWGLYIYAVNSGHVLEASLGYYVNPLVSVVIGLVVFKERLTPMQVVASVLALVGVVYFTVGLGFFPWIAAGLALMFALYGMLKKTGGYPAVPALAAETALIAPLALVFVGASLFMPGHEFLSPAGTERQWTDTVLLVGGGAMTVVPLLLFAKAANSIPLSWVGFLQYLSPTLSTLLGVFVFGEQFTQAHAVCFGLIWVGLALIGVETAWLLRPQARAKKAG